MNNKIASTIVCMGISIMSVSHSAWADGTETLGPPSIAIATGTGVSSAGTGMITQPGSISVDVPAGAAIRQVLLYWEGFSATNVPGDATIVIGDGVTSTEVVGTLIGGPTYFFDPAFASTYRADITGLGFVSDGISTLTVSGLAYTFASNGAGVLVIFDDGSSDAGIDLRDGSDLAFINFGGSLQSTVPQTYTFAPSASDRIGNVNFFFASIAGTLSTGSFRPSVIEITVSGPVGSTTTTFDNVLDSVDGEEWDSFTTSVVIPAGATSASVQAISRDDLGSGLLPASLDWLAAAFSIEEETPPGVPGRMTGGGSVFRIDGTRVTRGFEIHCDLRAPNNIEVNWPGGNKFHLTSLDSAVCTDSPAIDQLPRSAPFDTFQGAGTGLFNHEPGATIEFVFVDAGEPGRDDTASIKVWNSDGDLVLDVAGNIKKGNIQAHKDNKSTL